MSVIESFIIHKLKAETPLYKGMSAEYDPIYNKYCWFSFTPDDASQYDKTVHAVQTKRELKLINIQSMFFQMDFTEKMKLRYGGLDAICLLASIDKILATELMNAYPIADGYIVPNEWPSCFHDGNFHKEVCIFKPRNAIVYKSKVKRVGGKVRKAKGTISGGNDPRNDISMDEWNNYRKDSLRAIGWTGPLLFDDEGWVRLPTLEEIDRFRQMSIHPSTPEWFIADLLESRRAKGILTPNYDKHYFDTVEYVN
jgi:hypothetical protein